MKRLTLPLLSILFAMAASTAVAEEVDFSKGVLVVNEDWYGHQNSTVNYLLPDDPDGDYWHYRVIQEANPGKQLGCTNQYGALWNGRFYLIAKQDKDPGASVQGGRITVCDAKTMEILHQQATIDPSGAQCDGRGFVGVDEHKGYISTSNGIWIFNLDTYTIEGQVSGSANPNAGGDNDKPNTDPTGALYHGQAGSMVLTAGKVFAAHQQYGLLVIDPTTDSVIETISMESVAQKAGIGSVVLAKDGSLWVSVAKNVSGTGATLPYLMRVNPVTLETEIVEIPEGSFAPSNSWYAWTPDTFCASSVTNSLYWSGGENSWFSSQRIFKMDVDTRTITKIVDLIEDGEDWKVYGCSMRLHPITDEIYVSLYHQFGQPVYITRRYTADGEKIQDYDMIQNYWFPSLFVFPQDPRNQSGIEDIAVDRPAIADDNVYDLMGRRVGNPDNLAPGIYIRGGKKFLVR